MNAIVAVAAAGAGVLIGPTVRWEAYRTSMPNGALSHKECPQCTNSIVRMRQCWSGHAALPSGGCGQCGWRFGPPPGSVEVAAAAAFAALAIVAHDALTLLAYCWLVSVGLALSLVDVAVHRLPNRLTGALAAGVLVLLGIQAVVSHAGDRLLEASASAVGAALFYLVMWAVTAGGVGLGDAKLAVGLGLAVGWSGWAAVFAAVTLGLFLTGMTAVVLLVLRRVRRKDALPHGPFMVLGSLVVLVLVQL